MNQIKPLLDGRTDTAYCELIVSYFAGRAVFMSLYVWINSHLPKP